MFLTGEKVLKVSVKWTLINKTCFYKSHDKTNWTDSASCAVQLSQLLISAACWSQLIVNLSWYLISVNCLLSWLSISVACWSQLIVDISWLLISVDCWSQSICDLSWFSLYISVDCPSQSIVNLKEIKWEERFSEVLITELMDGQCNASC